MSDLFPPATSLDTLFHAANETTTLPISGGGTLNNWLVRLSDGSELTYTNVRGDLSIPADDLRYRTIVSYQISLASPLPSSATITFRPPAREAADVGARLEFDNPVCRMRLASDGEMDLPLDYGRWSFPSVSFVEDV